MTSERCFFPGKWGAARVFVLLLVFWCLAVAGARPTPALDFQLLMLSPIGGPLPEFTLPPLEGEKAGLSSADLSGQVALLNVFASWCAPCREEHPVLLDLAADGVPLYGLNYKDPPAAARRWLETLGNPYRRIGADHDGSVAASLDLRGLPQSVLVDKDGRIAYVHVGALTTTDVERIVRPLIATLRERAP